MTRKLLEIIGRRVPAVYDVIPRGPLQWLDMVALNPQPLPPRELGAALAVEFLRTAATASRLGLDPSMALADLDDWCPTRPRRPRLPPWWPPVPDPEPEPDWLVALHLGFAARLAVLPAHAEAVAPIVNRPSTGRSRWSTTADDGRRVVYCCRPVAVVPPGDSVVVVSATDSTRPRE